MIISASVENWIRPWSEKNGIDLTLSTLIEVKNGLLTGLFLSKNCYGKEKVNRLLAEFPNRSDYHLIVYGDSAGDKELIDFADEGYYL
ncbi:HAD superfamily phosphoserine phosphatase-like hydrolase [Dysgonomonas sp. PH5-45]|uniref:HAD-IB family phosphatase n=1 Tax=unclassified Dysgonomonas TaxID=2630389 RepID=UPI0024772D94|nr:MULTISPECIES: HAD-IB family phosphatase [unclassified Dysgonomonas]MDH6355202.1 HAD superfamily phosphoserine phosphatase-like hydrolase [Dysgonomonas sp. PH5-45]MDH6388072.1 HAD superfamily phosphoserine phosphatase-like hydrolase [Dysgonomonas sp. PH5-37]